MQSNPEHTCHNYLRLNQIIGDPKAKPPIPPRIPVSKTTLYDWVNKGLFPAPIKIGRASLWREDEISEAIEGARRAS